MTFAVRKYAVVFTLAVAAGLLWNGEMVPSGDRGFISQAEAIVGRPATPVSYAGVARRSTVGAGQVGVGYSGGVGVNLGGPVNRVGVR
jgi:hypothetical protein